MIMLSERMRLRYCDDICFVVDITNNKIYKFDSQTIKFLEKIIRERLRLDDIEAKNVELSNFIHELMSKNIIVEKL